MNERDCDNCIHNKQRLSKYGEIYYCDSWDCKPEKKKDDSSKSMVQKKQKGILNHENV